MARSLTGWFTALLVGSMGALFGSACAPESPLPELEQGEERASALSLPLEELPFHKDNAPAGLTILRKKSEFTAFFGAPPPADLSFNSSWVLHYSTGVQSSGGYGAEVVSVDREGSASNKHLVVTTRDVSPGPGCMVTMALTNPQHTVKIPKQKKTIPVEHVATSDVTDCSEPDFCASALCPPETVCDELQDACVEADFCPLVRCANGYVCDEAADACVAAPCDPGDAASCPSGFACENHIVCITWPCPEDWRCQPLPEVTCDDIGWVGTCQGSVLKYCVGDDMTVVDCAPGACGYSDANDYYDCQ